MPSWPGGQVKNTSEPVRGHGVRGSATNFSKLILVCKDCFVVFWPCGHINFELLVNIFGNLFNVFDSVLVTDSVIVRFRIKDRNLHSIRE